MDPEPLFSSVLLAGSVKPFTPETLIQMLRQAGFERIGLLSSEDEKEISIVAGPGVPDQVLYRDVNISLKNGLDLLDFQISFLRNCEQKFKSLIGRKKKLGIFGTSIAATWLSSSCDQIQDFFVDEDRQRTGQKYHDRDVLLPKDMPDDSVVFVPLPPKIASTIIDRLDPQRVSYYSLD